MGLLDKFITYLPEVKGPQQKRLPFKEKLKWTLIILVLFFVMGLIPLFGLGENALQQFEFLSIILGASFGSIISLGIGPIVTSSIVLQLLSGTGILNMDTTTTEGRQRFQGLQKLLSIFFIVLEGGIYVLMGGLAPSAALTGTPLYGQLQILLIFQLILGGLVIMFMDEVVSKWGFGSGISLFIAAGVAQQIFIRTFNFLPSPTNPEIAAGAIPALFQSLAIGDVTTAALQIAAITSTVLVFAICVFGQAMKVEIPLSFGKVRGYGMRWPLNFFYTSNIPVILIAALMANIQLFARLLENWGLPLLGTFSGNTPISGIVYWVSSPNIVQSIIQGSFSFNMVLQALTYILVFIIGSVIFSIFWMQTAGMDAASQAKQIMSSGLQIPGFRRDERVLEKILKRYIWPLTIVGGAAVGLLAAVADLTGALSNGTGILLAVMIVYKLYEEIAKQHMMDMHPAMRKFME
ncbi:preprotein translocase subunit SecY [Candidatus Woesearchaeota archaeon]|jgi:preprotein translocase subunit SecY|nr:preprotein translocase subunit SecY [Candidatus Woesearchaeota archaeon]MBT5397318.1 preprotein translocase subunit SecY [Candidatus Woesearchaeota archaeon]MBT5924799.1 preprotein translocase subunit SecY [Candidatus Woesearchaeota archaeon]MBT6367837.1 preprotein translocase subunit SecY [Candidatus Woesearchaeota archaeon]MBT7762718.1 preprotein translocase subunit SecY [Candidatus Woesearchaeota archaeon]